MAVISAVFTIGYVAELLGEDEDWLHELSISMFQRTGACTSTAPFTEYGIDCLKQIIDEERAAGRAPKPVHSAE